MDEYKKKIERILSNKLASSGDIASAIKETHIWLGAEWLCTDMEMSVCNALHTYIDDYGYDMKDL